MAERTLTAEPLQNVEEVIRSLRERVLKITGDTKIILIFIAASMAAGFAIVATAGTIAAYEIIDYLGATKSISDGLRENQRAINGIKDKLGEKTAEREEALRRIGAIDATLSESLASIKQLSGTLPEVAVRDTEHQRVAFSSIAIRITTALLLGFLINVLLNVYRYNTRLIAFYEARADALSLAGRLNLTALDKTAKLLYPSSVDLDKMPDAPAKQVIDLLKQVGSIAKTEQKSGTSKSDK